MANPKYSQYGFDKRLAHVVEECGEVVQVYGKIGRFGIHNVVPGQEDKEPGTRVTNFERLVEEVADLKCAICRLESEWLADHKPKFEFTQEQLASVHHALSSLPANSEHATLRGAIGGLLHGAYTKCDYGKRIEGTGE